MIVAQCQVALCKRSVALAETAETVRLFSYAATQNRTHWYNTSPICLCSLFVSDFPLLSAWSCGTVATVRVVTFY